MKKVVLSLGGSLINPEKIDTQFLQDFVSLIKGYPDTQFAIICGGGMPARIYQEVARQLGCNNDRDLDLIGIKATKINGELVRSLFGSDAYEKLIDNPEDKIKTNKKIIVGAGYEPGYSSDVDAILLAKNIGAKVVINLSNIDYLYDKDPKKFKDAQKIEKISFKDLLKITGEEWVPGKNVPFDPIASKKAMQFGISVVIMNGKKLDNLRNYFNGKKFVGSIIE